MKSLLMFITTTVVLVTAVTFTIADVVKNRDRIIDSIYSSPDRVEIEMERIVEAAIKRHCVYRLRTEDRRIYNSNRTIQCARLWLLYQDRESSKESWK